MEDRNVRTIDAVQDGDTLTEILKSGGSVPLIVTGTSMTPYLRNGRDTVILQKTDHLKTGKILFFRRNNGDFVLHRVRKLLPNGRLLMNGDAQNWCEIITKDQILAEAIRIRRKNGKEIPANGAVSRLWNLLWFPTRPIRPFIWKMWAWLKK